MKGLVIAAGCAVVAGAGIWWWKRPKVSAPRSIQAGPLGAEGERLPAPGGKPKPKFNPADMAKRAMAGVSWQEAMGEGAKAAAIGAPIGAGVGGTMGTVIGGVIGAGAGGVGAVVGGPVGGLVGTAGGAVAGAGLAAGAVAGFVVTRGAMRGLGF